jgi:FKBP-type peptidyl-prolyl cis-trans isomerase FkpA
MPCLFASIRRPVALAAVVLVPLLASCRELNPDADLEDVPVEPVDDRPEATTDVDTEYAASLDVDLARMTRAESGLYYEDVTIGTGTVAELGRHVEVHYRGWLSDGTAFDSSYERNEPIDFVLGTGAVIPGWEEGIVGMREGGRRRLVIPPALAYGRDGAGEIPPYATLVFETELVQVQ